MSAEVKNAKRENRAQNRDVKRSRETVATPKKKLDKATKLAIIISCAILGALLIMALVWVLVANLAPTKIERVTFENDRSYYATEKFDETDRAKMLAVEDALAKYGVQKGDEFCLNYTYKNSYSSYQSTNDGVKATIYWRDGTKQVMDCTTKSASSAERSRISGLRYAIEDALAGDNSSYRYDYDVPTIYDL
jgi:hypothetical protein